MNMKVMERRIKLPSITIDASPKKIIDVANQVPTDWGQGIKYLEEIYKLKIIRLNIYNPNSSNAKVEIYDGNPDEGGTKVSTVVAYANQNTIVDESYIQYIFRTAIYIKTDVTPLEINGELEAILV